MNVKLFPLIFLLFALVSKAAKADDVKSFTITGQVVDSLTDETVPYATLRIALAKTPDKPVKLLACDEDGRFETSLVGEGRYIISLQSIGKAPAQRTFTLSARKPQLNLGKLYMHEDNQRLGEVTVTAQKPLVKVEIDKLSYSLEDDPEAQTNNTLDMLRKVPMITVDGEDKIELKGSSNYKIYLNGKPSNLLSGQNASDVLKSMPASSVKRIEVITDPGAKYDAEGVGGIIDIITVKNALQGYTGTIRANGSVLGRFGGGGYVSAKIGKLGLTANYNYNRENSPWTRIDLERTTLVEGRESLLQQSGRNKNKGPFQFGYLEASYEFDTLNLLSVGANLFNGKVKILTEDATKNWEGLEPLGDPLYAYRRVSESEQQFGSTAVNVDFQHSTSLKDELLTLSYRYNHEPNDNEDHSELSDVVNYPDAKAYPKWNINDASTDEHTGQVDYTRPTWKGQTVEVGAKYIFRRSSSNTLEQILDEETGAWNDVSSTNSAFKHTQHIYSAYLGYAAKVAKFGLKGGVRAEGTSLDVKFARDAAMDFNTDYFDVVPNATVSYQLSMAQQLRVGYNMRISRPGIWYLNPFVRTIDPQNISYGNPRLDSEKSHTVSFNYSMFAQKININVSANYTFVDNSIEQYSFVREDGVTVTTYDNIGKKKEGGVFVYGSWNPVNWFRIYMNGGVNYVDLKTNSSESFAHSNHGVTGRIFAGMQFTLPKDFALGANGGGYSRQIMLQGERSSFQFVSLYVNKSFLKKKLTIGLNMNSPFMKDMKGTTTVSDPTFRQVTTDRWRIRDVRLSVSYRFGTMKEAIKKVRRGITNDDQKAGGNAAGGIEGGV